MTWIGVLVMFFFYPAIRKWQYYLLLPIILFITVSFYRVNHESLRWYSTVTNIYYEELLSVSPDQPELYKGLIFLSTSKEVLEINSMISRKYNLVRGKMEELDADKRWAPVAYEAGFKKVLLCKDRHKHQKLCKKISKIYNAVPVANMHDSGLYKIIGEHNGFLMVSLNGQVNL